VNNKNYFFYYFNRENLFFRIFSQNFEEIIRLFPKNWAKELRSKHNKVGVAPKGLKRNFRRKQGGVISKRK